MPDRAESEKAGQVFARQGREISRFKYAKTPHVQENLGAGPIAGLGNFGSTTTPTRFELKKEKQQRNSKRHDYGALCNRGRKLCVGVVVAQTTAKPTQNG